MTIISPLPRYPLAFLPTPLHSLPRLSAWLTETTGQQVRLWVKRDDQTGLAFGGNKTRKLEFLVADAIQSGRDTLITTGAAQSNHCRQTAAAARQAGLDCHLVLSSAAGADPSGTPNGNLLLDALLGATVHWTTRAGRMSRLDTLADELTAAGRRPYIVTLGGSDPVGALGYVAAMEEVYEQALSARIEFDAIVVASSSGGTQAGMVAGAWALGWDIPVIGMSIDAAAAELQALVADLATQVAQALNQPHTFEAADIRVDDGYLGAGYGVVGELERHAIQLLARTEGLFLDPVYTGRAFGGLLDALTQRKEDWLAAGLEPNILFWHTGGAPALFAYAGDLI
jgi:L-cysteate sulfo-lyase